MGRFFSAQHTGRRVLLVGGLGLVGLLGGLSACQDAQKFTGIGGGDTGGKVGTSTGVDTTPPSFSLQPPLGALEVGDTLTATVTDVGGVSKAAVFMVAGKDSIVWSSDTVAVAGDSMATVHFVVKTPVDSIPTPYGRLMKLVGWSQDVKGNKSYAGQAGATRSDLQLAAGTSATILEGRTVKSPVSIDDATDVPGSSMLYYVSVSANALRAYQADSQAVSTWSLAVGSKPSKVTVIPRGVTGSSEIVTVNSGGRELSHSSLGTMIAVPTMLGRVASPELVLNSSAGGADHVPGYGVAGVVGLCRSGENCRTLVSVQTSVSKTNFIHSVQLSGNPMANFEFVAPNRVNPFIFPDTSADSVRVSELVGSSFVPLFSTVNANRCGTFYDGTMLMAARADGVGALYTSGSLGQRCGVVRLKESAGTYSVDLQAGYNATGDPRIASVKGLWVDGQGQRVLIETASDVLLADSTLHVGAAASQSGLVLAPMGAGFLRGSVGSLSDGEWVVVASDGALTVFRSSDFRPLAIFKIKTNVTGHVWMLPTGKGDGIVITGVSTNHAAFVSVHTSVADIQARALKLNILRKGRLTR